MIADVAEMRNDEAEETFESAMVVYGWMLMDGGLAGRPDAVADHALDDALSHDVIEWVVAAAADNVLVDVDLQAVEAVAEIELVAVPVVVRAALFCIVQFLDEACRAKSMQHLDWTSRRCVM